MKRGEVVEIDWQFSDLTGSKKLPAVVVQADYLAGLIDAFLDRNPGGWFIANVRVPEPALVREPSILATLRTRLREKEVRGELDAFSEDI